MHDELQCVYNRIACFPPPLDWLPCNCRLMHFLKFSSCWRQSIPPHPRGASRCSNGFSQQQRHVATDASNLWRQGGQSKLEKGILMICSQMWALTWKFMAGKLMGWESMKELMLNVNLWQIETKSLDKRKVELRPHKKQYIFKCRRFEVWDENWMGITNWWLGQENTGCSINQSRLK